MIRIAVCEDDYVYTDPYLWRPNIQILERIRDLEVIGLVRAR